MKKIKVLGLETHYRADKQGRMMTSGVDYARVILPISNLPKDRFKVEIRKDPFTKDEPTWENITRNWDIIFTSYIDSPEGYVGMAMAAEKNGCKIVVDLDDNVWELTKDNPVYERYHKGSEPLLVLSDILRHAQNVSTTNKELANKMCYFTGREFSRFPQVIPNYIDLTAYDYKKIDKKPKDKITILHAGSSTHWKDLREEGFVSGVKRILDEYPNAEFVTIGNWIPEWTTIAGPRYRQMQGQPNLYDFIDKLWPTMCAETDIVVVPLAYDNATICKSGIKYLEFSAGKVPGVYANIRQYKELLDGHPERGYLAKTGEEWYQAIKKLIDSEQLRRGVGESAYQYVKDNHTIQGNIESIAKYLTELK